MKQLLAISILVLIFVGNAYAPDVPKLKVCVLVDEDKEDKTEQMTIESHLKRELRALGNVVIVDKEDDWKWIIIISILGHTYKDGTKAPHMSIAFSLQRRATNLSFKWPNIPVYVNEPLAAHWLRDDLPNYCIRRANDCDKVFKGILNYRMQ